MKSLLLLLALGSLSLVSAQVAVQDVDNPGRNPVMVQVNQNTTGTYNEIQAYTVPTGMRLIIDYIGGLCEGPSTLRGVQVFTWPSTMNYRFPINTTYFSPNYETFFATSMKAYAEAGTSVYVNFFGNTSQTLQCNISMSGHLVTP